MDEWKVRITGPAPRSCMTLDPAPMVEERRRIWSLLGKKGTRVQGSPDTWP
jgi:hypothetical protein